MKKHTITPKQIADGLHAIDVQIDALNVIVMVLEVDIILYGKTDFILDKFSKGLLKEAKLKRLETISRKENYLKFFIFN